MCYSKTPEYIFVCLLAACIVCNPIFSSAQSLRLEPINRSSQVNTRYSLENDVDLRFDNTEKFSQTRFTSYDLSLHQKKIPLCSQYNAGNTIGTTAIIIGGVGILVLLVVLIAVLWQTDESEEF